jgi:hypothetical protein
MTFFSAGKISLLNSLRREFIANRIDVGGSSGVQQESQR